MFVIKRIETVELERASERTTGVCALLGGYWPHWNVLHHRHRGQSTGRWLSEHKHRGDGAEDKISAGAERANSRAVCVLLPSRAGVCSKAEALQGKDWRRKRWLGADFWKLDLERLNFLFYVKFFIFKNDVKKIS